MVGELVEPCLRLRDALLPRDVGRPSAAFLVWVEQPHLEHAHVTFDARG